MPRERRGCAVCDSLNRSFLCQTCLNGPFLEDRHRQLQLKRRERDAILTRLDQLLERKQAVREQLLQQKRWADALQDVTARGAAAQERLKQVQQHVEALQASTSRRRAELELKSAQLVAGRAEMLTHNFPTLIRYQSLTYSHVSAMLLREQRARMRELSEILPVRINALRSAGGPPLQITICNLRLPDQLAAGSSGSSSTAGGWQQLQPDHVNAALGYLLLFIDLVGTYMGGPLLHEARLQGSTSSLWEPHAFGDRRPGSAASVLPLFMNTSSGAASSSLQTQLAGSSVRYRTGPTFLGLPSLTRSNSISPSPSTSEPKVEGGSSSAKQRAQELRAAFDMLQRSLACFLRDKAAVFNMQLPQAWSPLAWLVVFCAIVKRDTKQDGKLVAASSLADTVFGDVGAAAGATGASAAGHSMLLLQSAMQHQEAEDDDEDIDGWDMVRAPYLPPPPSRPDEVEHWTRAMITDATDGEAAAAAADGLLAAGMAAGLHALPTERIRSLFSRG